MSVHNLEDLFVDKLKDVYDAERRITKALPKMVKNAGSQELASAFEEHLAQTEDHIERLDRIFENLDKTPGRKTCHGIVGILEEGQEAMGKEGPESVLDAAMIAGAQEVEHYEIAAYGCLRTWAELLGKTEEARLLEETLREETETDEKLTQLASSVNSKAVEGQEVEEENEESMAMVGVRRKTGNGRAGNGRSPKRTR